MFLQTWNDYKLTWNPEEYDNVTQLYVPAESIWHPDLVLYNKWVPTVMYPLKYSLHPKYFQHGLYLLEIGVIHFILSQGF